MAVLQTWPDGGRAEKTTEWKDRFQIDGDVEDGVGYSGCDFFMSRDGYRPTHDAPGPYSIRVSEAVRSDTISGFGLAPNRSHDTYRVEFQWIESDTPKPPPDNPPPPDNYVTQLQMENYCSHFMTNEEFTSALREYLDVLENMIKKWS